MYFYHYWTGLHNKYIFFCTFISVHFLTFSSFYIVVVKCHHRSAVAFSVCCFCVWITAGGLWKSMLAVMEQTVASLKGKTRGADSKRLRFSLQFWNCTTETSNPTGIDAVVIGFTQQKRNSHPSCSKPQITLMKKSWLKVDPTIAHNVASAQFIGVIKEKKTPGRDWWGKMPPLPTCYLLYRPRATSLSKNVKLFLLVLW